MDENLEELLLFVEVTETEVEPFKVNITIDLKEKEL